MRMLHEECAVFLPFHVTVSKFAKMLVNLQLVLNSVLDSSGLSSDIVIFSGITAADAKAGVLLSMPRRQIPCQVLDVLLNSPNKARLDFRVVGRRLLEARPIV